MQNAGWALAKFCKMRIGEAFSLSATACCYFIYNGLNKFILLGFMLCLWLI